MGGTSKTKAFGANSFKEIGFAMASPTNGFGPAKKFDAKSLGTNSDFKETGTKSFGANDFKEICPKRNSESHVPTEVLQKISEVRSLGVFKATGTAKSFGTNHFKATG